MKFTNFQRKTVRAMSAVGGHTIKADPGAEIEVPAHLEELALASGLVPSDEFEAKRAAGEEDAAKAEAEAKAKADAEEAKAAEKKAAALAEAASNAEVTARVAKSKTTKK